MGKLYVKNDELNINKEIATVKNGEIYTTKNSFELKKIFATYSKGFVYAGTTKNVLAMYEDGKIFSGEISDTKKQIGCYENGKIYIGNDLITSNQVGIYETKTISSLQNSDLGIGAAAAFLVSAYLVAKNKQINAEEKSTDNN